MPPSAVEGLVKDVRKIRQHLKEIDDRKPALEGSLSSLERRAKELECTGTTPGELPEGDWSRPCQTRLLQVGQHRPPAWVHHQPPDLDERDGWSERKLPPLHAAGWLPAEQLKFSAVGQDGAGIKPKSVTITGGGKVSYWLSGFDVNSFVSLDGISFVASQ
jgi:hypothetical protein